MPPGEKKFALHSSQVGPPVPGGQPPADVVRSGGSSNSSSSSDNACVGRVSISTGTARCVQAALVSKR